MIVGSFLILCGLTPLRAKEVQIEESEKSAMVEVSDSTIQAESMEYGHKLRESLFPEGSRSLAGSHFTWGAEVGFALDMTGNDLSTFNIDAIFGYKNPLIRTAGVGVGIHRSIGNANMFIPLYALFRSSFRRQPSIAFLNLKLGYSFNTLSDTETKGGFQADLGVGFNLAMSKRFQSHLILSCGYFLLDRNQALSTNLSVRNIYLAQLMFGMNF